MPNTLSKNSSPQGKKHLTFSTKCGRINMKREGHSPNQKGNYYEESHHESHR